MNKDILPICKTCEITLSIKHTLSECRRYTNDLILFNIPHKTDASLGPRPDSNNEPLIFSKMKMYVMKFSQNVHII